ncbi:hypothetical protein RJT34_14801 [Clitoria ternatea]|uniref:PGG domain-containing protein n=1 Tax=Clitoria ternatea TaxID=43366 RepID=A0AAN9JTH6_CLITE
MDSATATPEAQVAVNIGDSAVTNTEPQLTAQHNGDPTNTRSQLTRHKSATYKRPLLDFLDDTNDDDANRIFVTECVPLHMHTLGGNWEAAKRMLDKNAKLKSAAIATGWATVLHVAAGTNHYHFVEELLKLLKDDEIELLDEKGNTAFCFVAAAGNMRIAELLLKRDPRLPTIKGGHGMTPLQFAALQGRCQMAWRLYKPTIPIFEDMDWKLLFFTCIETGIYDLALKLATEREELALTRDENNQTALHLLAQLQKPLDSRCKCSEHHSPIIINPRMKKHVVLQLVKCLWTTIIHKRNSRQIVEFISNPYPLLFDAARVGNFGFLSELISAYPSLMWQVDSRDRSIIHIAVLYRHASIYNLIHEIGSLKDIIVTFVGTEDRNTLLHLAAKLAPPGQLELISGAAFQMSLEILWFKEVRRIMPPSFISMKNSEDLTAQELFTREHADLRKNAESWMKHTAESCMLISTVIATGVFSAAISLPGGMDDQKKTPNYLDKPSFLVFAISDATAFISSATAILIFMSILVSRYAEDDFHQSLPLKLILGLITLFISITSMMVAFGSAFFITYYYGLKWVPGFVSALACLPILVFIILQFSLWSDIIYSTYYCRTQFKPGKKMLYVVE